MSKLFQIYEKDLAELESSLPQLSEAMSTSPDQFTPRVRTQWRRIQSIINNVRWNYGPPSEIETIPCDSDDDFDQQSGPDSNAA